ncbi:hypothetical protein TW65_06552 [Stemphylium lycopersici]|nr:hypothetical protein TW65_06552 [Stemphylium lycopersici]
MSRFSPLKRSQRSLLPLKRTTTATQRPGPAPKEEFDEEEEIRLFEFDEELQARAQYQENEAKWHVLRSPSRKSVQVSALRSLPNEILSEFIAPLAAPSYLQGVFAVFGETFNLLPELKKRPAGHYGVSVRAALFETRIKYGRTSYITGLYNKQVPKSSLIKTCDESYDHIVVWLDRIGVTNVTFPRRGVSLPTKSGSQWTYAVIAVNDHVDIVSKGVFLERITGTPVHHILWNSTQSPLLLRPSLLPNIHRQSRDDDVLVRYVPLRDTSGISVAFIAGEVLAIVSHTQSDNLLCLSCPTSSRQAPDLAHVHSVTV